MVFDGECPPLELFKTQVMPTLSHYPNHCQHGVTFFFKPSLSFFPTCTILKNIKTNMTGIHKLLFAGVTSNTFKLLVTQAKF